MLNWRYPSWPEYLILCLSIPTLIVLVAPVSLSVAWVLDVISSFIDSL